MNDLPCIDNILQFGSKKLQKIRSKTSNPFWQDVLEAYSRFSIDYEPDTGGIMSESLWFSDYSKFKCSIVRDWDKKGVRFIADLIDENTGQLLTRNALQLRYGIKMTILCYTSLVKSLPNDIKHNSLTNVLAKPIIPTRLNLVLNENNFSRFAYDITVRRRQPEIKRSNECQKQKWLRDIGEFDSASLMTLINATRSTHLIMFH